MPTLLSPTELTDRSDASQSDHDALYAAIVEWYVRTGQAPRRREFQRDDRCPAPVRYTNHFDTFAQARDSILSDHDSAYNGVEKRADRGSQQPATSYSEDDLRSWIVSWTLELGEPPKRNEFHQAAPTPSASTYERQFEGAFTEIRDRILLEWLNENEVERKQYLDASSDASTDSEDASSPLLREADTDSVSRDTTSPLRREADTDSGQPSSTTSRLWEGALIDAAESVHEDTTNNNA